MYRSTAASLGAAATAAGPSQGLSTGGVWWTPIAARSITGAVMVVFSLLGAFDRGRACGWFDRALAVAAFAGRQGGLLAGLGFGRRPYAAHRDAVQAVELGQLAGGVRRAVVELAG